MEGAGVDFRTATSRVMALGVPAREIAAALGLQPNTVRVMRLDPSSPNRRSPPADWRAAVAGLVRDRSAELTKLAAELEG